MLSPRLWQPELELLHMIGRKVLMVRGKSSVYTTFMSEAIYVASFWGNKMHDTGDNTSTTL